MFEAAVSLQTNTTELNDDFIDKVDGFILLQFQNSIRGMLTDKNYLANQTLN